MSPLYILWSEGGISKLHLPSTYCFTCATMVFRKATCIASTNTTFFILDLWMMNRHARSNIAGEMLNVASKNGITLATNRSSGFSGLQGWVCDCKEK